MHRFCPGGGQIILYNNDAHAPSRNRIVPIRTKTQALGSKSNCDMDRSVCTVHRARDVSYETTPRDTCEMRRGTRNAATNAEAAVCFGRALGRCPAWCLNVDSLYAMMR